MAWRFLYSKIANRCVSGLQGLCAVVPLLTFCCWLPSARTAHAPESTGVVDCTGGADAFSRRAQRLGAIHHRPEKRERARAREITYLVVVGQVEHGIGEVVEEHGLILVLRDVGQAERGCGVAEPETRGIISGCSDEDSKRGFGGGGSTTHQTGEQRETRRREPLRIGRTEDPST